jgi:NAD(P)H-nitrite reductase large subunit
VHRRVYAKLSAALRKVSPQFEIFFHNKITIRGYIEMESQTQLGVDMTRSSRCRVVCECLKVTEGQVVDAIRAGSACSLREIAQCTEAGAGCNSCHSELRRLLQREAESKRPQPYPAV